MEVGSGLKLIPVFPEMSKIPGEEITHLVNASPCTRCNAR